MRLAAAQAELGANLEVVPGEPSLGARPNDHPVPRSTLPEIEKGRRRLVALRQGGSITRAAARLGMSHVALSQWFGRRGISKTAP